MIGVFGMGYLVCGILYFAVGYIYIVVLVLSKKMPCLAAEVRFLHFFVLVRTSARGFDPPHGTTIFIRTQTIERQSTIDYQLSTINERLSTSDYQLSIIDYQLSTIDNRQTIQTIKKLKN